MRAMFDYLTASGNPVGLQALSDETLRDQLLRMRFAAKAFAGERHVVEPTQRAVDVGQEISVGRRPRCLGFDKSLVNDLLRLPVDPVEYFEMYPELDIPPEQLDEWSKNRIGAAVGTELAEHNSPHAASLQGTYARPATLRSRTRCRSR